MTSMMNETRVGDGRSRGWEAPPDHRARERGGMMRPETLAKGLGWFSVGLGVAQIVAPRRVARFIGVRPTERNATTLRALGARELASGVGILARRRPTPFVWARVGGDMMDLALLGRSFDLRRNNTGRLAATATVVAAVTMLDLLASQQLSSEDADERSEEEEKGASNGQTKRRTIHVMRAITIDRGPEEVYAFWRDFENLPRFMEHLESVQVTTDRRSHWKVKAPAGRSVEWDAEMTEDVSGERIAWRSLPGADVPNRGVVRFLRAPADGGTEVHVDLRYEPPAGRAGAAIAKLFGEEPELQLATDLRRFKQVLETGEVVRSDASIHEGMHPAQPPAGNVAVGIDVEGSY
jgi:uncharacterized membrane protein